MGGLLNYFDIRSAGLALAAKGYSHGHMDSSSLAFASHGSEPRGYLYE